MQKQETNRFGLGPCVKCDTEIDVESLTQKGEIECRRRKETKK